MNREVMYIVYDKRTYKIYETFKDFGQDLSSLINRYPVTLSWINVTHPKHQKKLAAINKANKTNYK